MEDSGTEIYVDLNAIAPELNAARGAGKINWVSSLVAELRQELSAVSDKQLAIQVEPADVAPSTTKSPEAIMVGGIVVSMMTAAGYSLDPKKATQIVESIWKALKKILQKDTHVKIESGGTKIDISTNNEDAARSLLLVGTEVAAALASTKKKATTKRKRVATVTPKKR